MEFFLCFINGAVDQLFFFLMLDGYKNTVKYFVRVMASRCVHEELENLPGPEERNILDRYLPVLLSPQGPRSKGKVARKGGVPFSPNTGIFNNRYVLYMFYPLNTLIH